MAFCQLIRKGSALLFFLCILSFQSSGQIGGRRSFEFLNLPGNARVAGLGGVNVSNLDKDVNMFLSNPALLSEDLHKHLSFNHFLFLSDISLSTMAFSYNFEKAGTFGLGLQYLNYGSFDAFDETGLEAGEFRANDMALLVGHSHTRGAFTMGANIKFVSTSISFYNASALLFDIGGTFKHPEQELTFGLSVKNLGFTLSEFTTGSELVHPFDVQLGTTFKPEHLPFRFSFTGYNLYPKDVSYGIPARGAVNNQDEPGTVDKIFRHIAIGTELLLSKNVHLRGGYNHLRRQELRLDDAFGGAGISLGFLVRIKAFEFAYTKAFYHVAGGTNYFTLTSNLNSVFTKKTDF